MQKLGIVVIGYNRAESMRNLLTNLLSIRSEIDLPLVISLDNNGTSELNRVVKDFSWPHGEKRVVIHPNKLGLVNHFIWAGDQTEEFENVLFLEDDLLCSPDIINYSLQLIDFYKDDDEIAAASLYNPVLVESTGTKFYQLQDEYDVYFFQQPYWGNIWFKDKWKKFKKYLESYEVNTDLLPPNVASWNESFKKKYIQFLVETNRTVVTPRVSLVTNNGIAGIHGGAMYAYQSVLQIEAKKYIFAKLSQSLTRYDCYQEIYPEVLKHYNKKLEDYNFCVDLLGIRSFFDKPYVLTTRRCNNPIMSFSSLMKPTEQSVILDVVGDKNINLCKSEDVITEKAFVRKRRYLDIKKNYHIGASASYYIMKDFVKSVFKQGIKLVFN